MSQTPISLTSHLRRHRNIKSPPPPSVVSQGVACFPPSTLQAHQLRVLDLLLLSTPSHRHAVLTVWPLASVPSSHVALDNTTLDSLHLTPAQPSQFLFNGATPEGKKKKGKRRNPAAAKSPHEVGISHVNEKGEKVNREKEKREEEGGREKSGEEMELNTVHVKYVLKGEKVCALRYVQLRVFGEATLEVARTDEYCVMVETALVGRVLVKGMRVPFSLLGVPVAFEVVEVEGGEEMDNVLVGRCDERTKVRFMGEKNEEQRDEGKSGIELLESIGGLDSQMKELFSLARVAFSDADRQCERQGNFTSEQVKKPRGALLHGPPGTGKTLLACATAAALRAEIEVARGPEVLGDYSGEAVAKVEACFARARRKRPCVVVLDEVDTIAPKRDGADTENVQRKLTAALLAILDGIDGSALDGIFVVGTTNKLESIDTAMRRAGRFDREIEVGVPDARARGEILTKMCGKARESGRMDASVKEVLEVGRVCYGFVGADLSALWREAVSIALHRGKDAQIREADMRQALRMIKPSALREVSVEIPTTRWNDIGGKAEAKHRLREAIEWPLSERGAALFASLRVTPPSGILLFGPPGCSKTLLARAVATELGANFISVKGAELLSKWVGESEKAVRAVFRRARQAAPCVVFFDEVDALAGKRSAVSGVSAQARVVAQLLAEMDGIERDDEDACKRVVVIAATNRPDCLDEAFLRPGRIDTQIYVGLPDIEERRAILKVHTRRVPLGGDVDLEWIAEERVTGGFSGAEVAAVVREAALAAMERDVEGVQALEMKDFEKALGRVTARTPKEVTEFFHEYMMKIDGRSRGLMRVS